MHAIQMRNFGPPLEVLEFIELPEPSVPAADEVLVGVEFAPINMNDLYLIEGVFPIRPTVPSVVGNEGVGRILAVGKDVGDLRVGDRVLIPLYAFSWRERMVLPAKGLFPLPAGADPRQLSMLGINPPTAALLLREYVDLQPGDWVAQNAANSGVGRSVIAIAKARGLRTINFVRRAELIAELKAAGGDIVLVDEAGALDEVRQAVGDGRVPLGIDGVAGGATATIAGALTQGGRCHLRADEWPAGHDQSNGSDRQAGGREGLFPELSGVRAEDPRGCARECATRRVRCDPHSCRGDLSALCLP